MQRGKHGNHARGSAHGRWKGGKTIMHGYLWVTSPGHPRATKDNYVKNATLVLESRLGRFLVEGELAHHLDRNRLNDEPENLELKTTQAHNVISREQRGYVSPQELVCCICGSQFTRPKKSRTNTERCTCSVRCRNTLIARTRWKNRRV
jgi:hypothetical protein